MTLLGGRGGRTDDWKTPHARARARAAERLEGPLDPAEEAWLNDHLAECTACAATAADYASQRLELRALRDRQPLPPRDLWARTAAAIEREAGQYPRRTRRPIQSLLAPYALLAGAVIVAVAVGSLSLSRSNVPTASAPGTASVAGGSGQTTAAAATPILVGPGSVAYLTQTDGQLQLNHLEFSRVCGPTTKGCEASGPSDTQTIGPVASPDTVFGAAAGAGDRPLVVVSKGNGSGGKVFAIAVATQQPVASPTPAGSSPTTVSPPPSLSPTPTPTPTSPPATPSAPPTTSIPPTATPSEAPSSTPSESPSASPSASVVEIARDLKVLDTTAAYAPDGSAFAFTARPDDGSHGPDIYLWHVGDAKAAPITTDHRSVFGSWSGGSIVGSTVTAGPNGRLERPVAFLIGPGATEPTLQPQTGLAWRPVVDPNGRAAVYWSGRLEPTDDGLGWTTRDGKLVVGRWDDVTPSVQPSASSSPTATATTVINDATSSPDESATAADDADQPRNRSETTIANGPLTDWDARWDITGTRLAVWIADENDPTVGRLSLYVVDPFDGKVDLSKPPLENVPALAGFSLADGHLAWAAPHKDGSSESSVLVLAWTGDEFGQIESAPGDILLVR